MSSEITAFLRQCQQDVDACLRTTLATLPQGRLREAMSYSLFNGGKRVRPALCYAAARIFGPCTELTHRASAAVELIHAYSLVHDDLPAMDNDDLRRGQPTCHIAFDEATAILAGDALQTLAFSLLAAPQAQSEAPHIALELIRLLGDASGGCGMVQGQALDLGAVDQTLTAGELEHMHRNKTGALINTSLQMGAVASGAATGNDLARLARFGSAIGLAFQVKDDILDVESSTKTLGKRQGADQALNKPTYTSLLGLDGAKQKLAELHRHASAEAAAFGEPGALLGAIADYIVNRTH